MGPSAPAPVYQTYTPPKTTDPSVIAAQTAAAQAQQNLRGAGATLLVTKPSSGADLLPSSTRAGGSQLLGGGT